MALPLDNPSYFAVTSGTLPCAKGKFRLFKKKMGATVSQEVHSYNEVPVKLPNSSSGRLRTLLRSVSSNSADSNQELLVLGEPRPSDIAPPSPYLSSHRAEKKLRRNKSNGESVSNDLTYSPLAMSEEQADEVDFSTESEEVEEVFLTEDTAKYYNLTATREIGRRHSIGTYLTQERERALSAASSNKSYRDDLPQATVHATNDGEIVKPTTTSSISSYEGERQRDSKTIRKRCSRCNAKGSGCGSTCSGMDDILIVSSKSSQAAALWVNYFGTCFEQISRQKDRQAFKIFHLGIDEVNETTGISPQLEQRVSGVKLNMVIVCPQLLDYVAAQPKSSASLCNLLKPDRTIAMLLGVTDDDLSDTHHTALVSYRQWTRQQVGQDQDQDFARDFLNAAMGIITKVARQQHAAAMEERTTFSVMPKKVKQSQNRLIVLLAEPLKKDDSIRVSVDKNGDLLEIKPVKRRNPYTLKFTMPDCCLEVSSIVNVLVEKNGNILGTRPVKCESRLRELDQILRTINDPVEFMYQTLGFSPTNRDQLDNWMVHSFQKNLPPHFNLVATTAAPGVSTRNSNSMRQSPAARHLHGHEEYPTLLHFAAKYGLERLAWQLLECPGGEAACDLRNACDLTPAEIAENAGHKKLASALRGYMQMNEFTNMYSQLKELSQSKDSNQATRVPSVEVDDEEYLLPRSLEMTYSVPPPARPYSPASQSNSSNTTTGYLEMQALPKSKHTQPSHRGLTGRTTPAQNDPLKHTAPPVPEPQDNRSETSASEGYPDKVQGELLEIINDFKNSVFTLSEVEKLVEEWRNRNDVQKSFKEKEEQLNAMRREYERLQQQMKDDMRRPTPFDRIKRLFGRQNRPKPTNLVITIDPKFETTYPGGEDKTGDGASTSGLNHLRPISSLSLQSTTSSSSSGRMSTLSGYSAASFGDSGTHSDHEDRKHLMKQTSIDHEYFEIEEPKKNNNNTGFLYTIPPAPKPFLKLNPGNKQHFSPIAERPPYPVPRIDSPTQDQYYIQFPPSGLPVNGTLQINGKPNSQTVSPVPITECDAEYIEPQEDPTTDYMNVSAAIDNILNRDTTEKLPEYINYNPAQELPPILPPKPI